MHPEGVCIKEMGRLPPPSPSDTMGYGQCTGGTHPTGMQSCFMACFCRAVGRAWSPSLRIRY